MMTIPMENENESSSKELVVNLFNKNVELEKNRRISAQARIPSDPSTWQRMRENYEAIVLEDHAFSEQHDIEYALWQLHYRRIEELRALFNAALASAGSAASQNGKGPGRSSSDRLSKIRSQLKTFLSEATGFYHDLMMKIKAKYGLPLEYFSDGNQIPMSKDGNEASEVNKWLISCHRCLIYLGDLARYKGLYGEGESKARDFAAASTHYLQASSLCPSNGNPHHQLAILAGYSNDELLSIYRYFRSLAVDNPFVTARDNLIIAFEKNRQNYLQLVNDGKSMKEKKQLSRTPGKGRGKGATRPSNKDTRAAAFKETASSSIDPFRAFIIRFIRLNGILFTKTSLETFPEVLSMVKNDLLELLPPGPDEDLNFGSDAADCRLAVVRIIAILIFTVQNVSKESESQSYADILQRSVLLQNALTGTFEFVGCMLERCILIDDPSSSYLLPGIMVFIEWLACSPDVTVSSELEEKQIKARTYFWYNCISLLNELLSNRCIFGNEHEEEMCFSNMSKYDESETANRLALPEDFELRGFLPLLPAQVILDFSRKHSFGGEGGNKEKVARVHRIVAAGKALTNFARLGQEAVYFNTKSNKFLTGSKPQESDDYPLTNPPESNLVSTVGTSVGTDAAYTHTAKQEVSVEDDDDDDDDEVIVFRPSTNEKHVDDCSLRTNRSDLLAPISEAGKIDIGMENGSFSVGHDSFFFQEDITPIPSVSVANATSQYQLPVQPVTSRWPVEHVADINGLANLNLMENASLWKSDPLDQFEVSEPAPLSVPYPRFVTNGAGHNYSNRVSQAAFPSTFDSIVFSEAMDNGLPVNSMSAVAPSLKKNPISRPVRHAGPPPGFASVPSKVLDESLKVTMNNNTNFPLPQMDDYSWLDRHSLPSANQNVGFSSSFNQVGPTIHSVNMSNVPNEIASFPFPGKQAPSLQVPTENHKKRQNYPYLEHMKPHENHQQQFQNGNQQHVGPQQYQGQSFWENSFFV